MPSTSALDAPQPTHQPWAATLLSLLFLVGAPVSSVFAHAGHGDEFHQSQSAQSAGAVQLDPLTSDRLGVKTAPVVPRYLNFGIKTTGQIETLPNQTVEVTTPVGGTILKLLVKPGDRVEAGQPVAVMTSAELAELRTTALDRQADAIAAVQQAEADLRLAEDNYQQQQRIAASELQEARVALSFAQEQYDRDRELVQNGALPRRQALASEAELAQAKAHLSRAESRLPVSEAQAQLKRARSAVQAAQQRVALSGETYQTRLRQLGTRQNQDGTITVTAPIAGVIAAPDVTPGDEVKLGESREDAGATIFTIINASRVQVAANIFEKDIDQIRQGQGVRGRVSSLPQRTFAGQISVIGAAVEGSSRVIPVKAELDNPGGFLKPGMFVELDVLTDRTSTTVLAVPQSAIVATNDQRNLVFVQNGTAFEPVEVSLGKEFGDFVEVKTGLFEGDQVVTQRANQLYAQSLRGGSAQPEAKAAPIPTNSNSQPQTVPWWWLVPATGAIAAGTFWAGAAWARRRDPSLATHLINNGNGQDQDLYLPPTSSTDTSLNGSARHPVAPVESAASHHQSH
jgi:membrane fusion protein, heavy metal efflux system